ncbi:MAG: hypothetical protein M3Y77_16870 [Actinomycetota bacterium]|nr:hypothetical protein [Actinomycetota bacterium]
MLAESADGRWYVATARDLTTTETRTFREKGRLTMSESTKLERLAARYDNTDTARELAEATAVAPHTPAGEPMTTFAVRLPITVLDHVREVAQQRNVTTSALIRRWVEVGIATDAHGVDDRAVPVQDLLELIGRAPHEHTTG